MQNKIFATLLKGSTAFHMSDDKDLKNVLKELKKKQTQKVLSKRTRSKSKGSVLQ